MVVSWQILDYLVVGVYLTGTAGLVTLLERLTVVMSASTSCAANQNPDT